MISVVTALHAIKTRSEASHRTPQNEIAMYVRGAASSGFTEERKVSRDAMTFPTTRLDTLLLVVAPKFVGRSAVEPLVVVVDFNRSDLRVDTFIRGRFSIVRCYVSAVF